MPEVSSVNVTALMDDALHAMERAHQLMVGLAGIAGFSRKRASHLEAGDEVGYGANEWRLVIDVENTCTAEGEGVTRVVWIDADDNEGDFVLDPMAIVDVKFGPSLEPF